MKEKKIKRMQDWYVNNRVYTQVVDAAYEALAETLDNSNLSSITKIRLMTEATITLDKKTSQVSILLRGLSQHVDQGWEAFDMKLGFIKSKFAKRTKSGDPYLDIPLRQGAPLGLSETPSGSVLGDQTRLLSGKPSDVREKAYRKLLRQAHKTDTRPVVFRRVSKKSLATSWWNKGHKADLVHARAIEGLLGRLTRTFENKVR